MKLEDIKLYNLVDEVLWYDWDPIGVNDDINYRDEYQSYTPRVFSMKINNQSREAIANFLSEVETKRMGFEANLEHCLLVADKIISLKEY